MENSLESPKLKSTFQVTSLITSNAFCIVQRAKAQSKQYLVMVVVCLKLLKRQVKSSHTNQVKLLTTHNAFCIVQRATAQLKTSFVRDYDVAEAPPGFQGGWYDCMYFFSLFLFILFAHLEFSCKFLYSRGYSAVSELSPNPRTF
jgi:hypothetical protein